MALLPCLPPVRTPKRPAIETPAAQNMPDDGHLLDLFNNWTPDAALRKKILVETPQKLYRFV